MLDNDFSTNLLESSLPGVWIAKHRRIWQMSFLDAGKLANFSHQRGLALFSKKDIIQLWQLGLIKADFVISTRKLSRIGLIHQGTDIYGQHIYSDERKIPQPLRSWKNALKTLKPLRKGVQLLFHPFRYYIIYHLNRAFSLNISKTQMLYQNGFSNVLDQILSDFNRWSESEQFIASIKKWNDITSLCIITEPCIYERIFHSIKYSLEDVQNHQTGAEEIKQHMVDYWNSHVEELYLRIGMERLEEIRQELCVDTEILDPNIRIHTLLCLGDSKLRIESTGHLGGALLLRTMAEIVRRAEEKAFDKDLKEEDELGFWWTPEGVKESIYGSNRLMDDHRSKGAFLRRNGLNYKPCVHIYGEGNTEYGAFNSFFKSMGIPVTNLRGLIKEGKSMATFFRDSLRNDIRDQMYSLVVIDGDVRENVRILESAARNNQSSKNDGIFGRFFLSQPDIEFANFEIEELEEILRIWIGTDKLSQADRELLHHSVKNAKNSAEFFRDVKHAALSLPQLVGYDKCEEWGEALIKFAWKHKFKQNRKRQIIEIVELVLKWEKNKNLERYEESQNRYMIDKSTGEFIPRLS